MQNKRIIAIYPGRFQPPGLHHYKAYEWLSTQFGKDNTFVVTSDKVEIPNSPFDFNQKKTIWAALYGVDNVVLSKNVYNPDELLKQLNLEPFEVSVVYMVGDKDMQNTPRFTVGNKKNGEPTYFQKYDTNAELKTANKHGYLITAPHIAINTENSQELSGTEIRRILSNSTIKDVDTFVKIFGKYDPVIADMVVNKIKTSVQESYWNVFIDTIIKEELIVEGGAAGHMPYIYELPNVKTGSDLIKKHNESVESIKKTPPSVKVDGLNTDVRIVTVDGVQQFVMDRGSKKDLDVKGLTKTDLLNRFGEGHGMIGIGGEVLDLFNTAMPTIKLELKSLGLLDNPNVLLNIEYVSGTSNIVSYGKKKFLAIHNLLEIVTNERGSRSTVIYPYDKTVFNNMVKKLQPVAAKFGYEIYGQIPAKLKKQPNFGAVLSKNITIPLAATENITKPLSEWLNGLTIPYGVKTKWIGKTEDAIAKKIFNAINSGVYIKDSTTNDTEQNLVISGYITLMATMLLGQEILNSLDSPIGSMEKQEGIVINDPAISAIPYKIIGDFIGQKPNANAPTAKTNINEGGNAVYSNSTIKREYVIPTVENALRIWGLNGVKYELIGNISKPETNDIDIAISASEVLSKINTDITSIWDSLEKYLKIHTPANIPAPQYKIIKGLQQFHISAPIIGSVGDYIQLDFMVGDVEWMRNHLSGAGEGSNYKARYRNILLAEIFAVSAEPTSKPGVYKKYQYNTKYGVEQITFTLDEKNKRVVSDKKLIFTDMDAVANFLFPGSTFRDIDTVEKLYNKLNSNNFIYKNKADKIMQNFQNTLNKLNLPEFLYEHHIYNISENNMDKQDLLKEALRNEIKKVLITEAFIDPWKQILDVLDQTHEVRRSILDDTIKLNLYPDQETADEVKRAYQMAKELEVLLNTILPKYKDMPIKEKS